MTGGKVEGKKQEEMGFWMGDFAVCGVSCAA